MKKKKSIRSELQKLLRPDKERKIKPAADEQVESNPEVQGQPEGEHKIILAPEEQEETKTERIEEIPVKEQQIILAPEEQEETKTEKIEEILLKEQQKLETESSAELEKKELTEPEILEQTELLKYEPAELQIDTPVRLRLKKQIDLSIDKNAEPQIEMYTNAGINTSICLKEQAYLNFSKMIMGKYGFGRLKNTFSKLIFRLYQMLLKDEEINANVEGDTIIKNYSNYYSTNKSVLNLITRSLGSNNSKSNKELNVPFYILKNSQSISRNHSGNKQEYEKEVIKLMYRVFSQGEQISGYVGEHGKLPGFRETSIINTLKIVNSAKILYENNNEYLVNKVYQNSNELHSTEVIEKQLIESKNRETLIDRVSKITQINSEPKWMLLKPKTAENQINTLDPQVKLNNESNTFSSDISYKSGTKLLYDNNQQSELRALVPEFSKSFGFEKQNLSNRTSIGSDIGRIKQSNSGSTNRAINRDINGSSNRVINRDVNGSINVLRNRAADGNDIENSNQATNVNINVNTTANTNEIIHRATSTSTIAIQNEIINKTTNISTNGSFSQTLNVINNQSTNEAKQGIINLIINRTINGATNGSSNKNITNNIITNRIANGVVNRTINGNSSGIINRTINGNFNGIINRTTTENSSEIINRTTNGSSDEIINRTTNGNSSGIINRTTNGNSGEIINGATNGNSSVIINRTTNGNSSEITNRTTNGNSSGIINRTTNGNSSGITNRTTNGNSSGNINRTINGNSSGIINRTTNIIANTIQNRLENNEKTSRDPQLLLINNNYTPDSKQVELIATPLERDEKVENRQQHTANEDSKQSEILIHTTVANKVYTTKTRGLLKSALIQADGAISKIIRSFSNNQKVESIEGKASKKNIYQDGTRLIQAEVRQDRYSNGISNNTGKQLIDGSLIHCNPHIKETPRATEEENKNVMKADNQVSAKSVTSSKSNRINNLELEEVNQIADKVLKIIEKKIAIQKDRRGLR